MSNYSDEIISEFFNEQGYDCYLKKDIYDNNGRLLLAKGQKVRKTTKIKLENMGFFQAEKLENLNHKTCTIPATVNHPPEAILFPIIQTFVLRKNIYDNHITEQPYRILTSIIFESKSEPWWGIVNAMINYSEYLYTHSIDVAMIALILAVELGYSDNEQWNLGLGAFLHDIGKLLIPKSIKQRPGNMAGVEKFHIRQHCELGANFLNIFDLAKQCTDIVLHHHERLDGSGYPQGLKKDEISQEVQIVMVADVLDDLSLAKPHRSTHTINSAINMLKNDKEKYPQDLLMMLERILQS